MPLLDASLGFQVNRTARALGHRLGAALQPHGLTPSQWVVLEHVTQHPDRHQERLATDLGTDAATLVEVLRRLESRGLVERIPDPADRRRRLVRPTAHGDPSVGARLASEVNEAALSGFSSDEREALRDFLLRIQRNLAAADDSRPRP